MRRTMTRGISLALLLLSLLGGGLIAPAEPAGAQQQPLGLWYMEWNREIQIQTPWGTCNWEFPDTKWFTVGRGEAHFVPQVNWGCSHGNGYIVGVHQRTDVYYESHGYETYGEHVFDIVLHTPGGNTINCGTQSDWATPTYLNHWINGWATAGQEELVAIEACGSYGHVILHYKLDNAGGVVQ